jgi:phosphoglycolate phosphatase
MLCLFDLDGTLIDSELGIFSCIRHALAQMQVPAPTPDALREWVGPPLHQGFGALFDNDAAKITTAIGHYHDRFKAIGWREHSVYPGMAPLIDGLLAAGHTLAVVTTKPRLHAVPIVENLPFAAAFQRVYGPEPSNPHCEKASMIAAALADFQSAPEQAVMIGDRRFDIEGAVANRVRGIGVLWGFGSREELELAGATSIVADPDGLAGLLAGGFKPADAATFC